MLKIYKIENFTNNWSCTIEVNEEFLILDQCKPDQPYNTLMAMKEMVLFWTDGDKSLEENDGDVTKTFLQQLAREITIIQISNNYNLKGVISEFRNMEGWCQMDGSYGLKIIDVDDPPFFEHREFEVEEVEHGFFKA